MSEPMGTHYYLSEEEAKVVGRALGYFVKYLHGEFEKIARPDVDVSDLLKEAARAQYQELVTPVTVLHTALAEAFPALRQP